MGRQDEAGFRGIKNSALDKLHFHIRSQGSLGPGVKTAVLKGAITHTKVSSWGEIPKGVSGCREMKGHDYSLGTSPLVESLVGEQGATAPPRMRRTRAPGTTCKL